MLIGFDASRAFVSDHTGTENYSLNLLRALAKVDGKNKYRVYLRGSRFTVHGSREKKTVNRELTTDNFKWPSNFEFVQIKPNRFWTQIGLALETWRNPVDLLFVPAHTLPILRRRKIGISNFQFPISNSRQTKYVVTIHDLGVEYLPNYHKFPQRYYLDLASKYAARHADAIIAPSAATKTDLVQRYQVKGKKVAIIAEGVDRNIFRRRLRKEIERVRKKYKVSQNYILFVGTVQPRKNLKMLISAFSKAVSTYGLKKQEWPTRVNSSRHKRPLPNEHFECQLVLAGKLGWDYGEILAAPKKFDVERWVKFLKYVDTSDLPALYSGARLFVFPSLFEGFGLPVLEAMACGARVAASDIGTNREIKSKLEKIGEAIVLIKPKSQDKWTEFLYQEISQYIKTKINISSEANLKEISGVLGTNFSWEKAARQTVSVFENC